LGRRPPNLYGASTDQRETHVVLTFSIAPNLRDDERDDLYVVGTMVIADCADDYGTEGQRFGSSRARYRPAGNSGFFSGQADSASGAGPWIDPADLERAAIRAA
jgi:hypothetical protein